MLRRLAPHFGGHLSAELGAMAETAHEAVLENRLAALEALRCALSRVARI